MRALWAQERKNTGHQGLRPSQRTPRSQGVKQTGPRCLENGEPTGLGKPELELMQLRKKGVFKCGGLASKGR